jgi:hypothetical protein
MTIRSIIYSALLIISVLIMVIIGSNWRDTTGSVSFGIIKPQAEANK